MALQAIMSNSRQKASKMNLPKVVTDTLAGSLPRGTAQDNGPFAPTRKRGQQVGIEKMGRM